MMMIIIIKKILPFYNKPPFFYFNILIHPILRLLCNIKKRERKRERGNVNKWKSDREIRKEKENEMPKKS